MKHGLLLLGFSLLMVWMPICLSSCSSSSNRGAEPSRSNLICQLHHSRVRDKVVTDLGDIYIYEVVHTCQHTGRWKMRAFHDDDHRGTMVLRYMENKPTSASVEFHEPYWLRFTASDGESTRTWDFIARQNERGRWIAQPCHYSFNSSRYGWRGFPEEGFDLEACLEPFNEADARRGVWNKVAVRVLGEPEAFGEELYEMIDERLDDGEFLSWIAIFVGQTWDDFDEEGKERARAAMERIPCEPVMRSAHGTWKRYVNAGRSALGDEFSQMVSSCDRKLLQESDTALRTIRRRIEDPAMVSRIDDKLASAGDEANDHLLEVWGMRLAHEPPPDQTLVDNIDRILIDERHFTALVDRLDSGFKLDEELREYLRDEFSDCCSHYHPAQEVLEHPVVESAD